MYFDAENLFSKDQAVTTSAASENVIDYQRNTNGFQKDVGPGMPVWLFITVSETFAGLTSMSVAFQTSDTEAFTTATTLVSTGDIPLADLVQGYTFPLTVVPDGCLRYVRLYYTVTGTGTAGTITAGVTADRQHTLNAGGSQ